MLGKPLDVLGDSNDRDVNRYQRVMDAVGDLEADSGL